MTENSAPSGTPSRGPSTLVIYYLAAVLWLTAGMVTIATSGEGSFTPYFCVLMGMLFFTLARRKRKFQDGEWPPGGGPGTA